MRPGAAAGARASEGRRPVADRRVLRPAPDDGGAARVARGVGAVSWRAYTPAELEEVARRLGGAGRTGDGWDCRCPAHDDGEPSLSLGLGEGGRLLWHCHAGCHQAAVLAGLRAAGVLSNGDARPAEPRSKARRRGRVVASYPYVDEAGVLLFEVVRFEPKDFRQRRPDGKGGWAWRLGDARRVLFRLPEVLAADEVVFCEGEKDALNVTAAGLCGTTSPQGAGSWRNGLAAPLAGKRVVILPDSDPAGRGHAHRVAAAARRHGALGVKVVELGGLAEHGDVSDWLNAGHTADELRALIADAPEWRPVGAEPAKAPPAASGGREDLRVEIELKAGERDRIVRRCVDILGEEDDENAVYGRGLIPSVIRFTGDEEKLRAGKRETTVPADFALIQPAEPEHVMLALDRRAAFWFDHPKYGRVSRDTPGQVARIVLKTGSFRPLLGVIRAPAIRADGSIVESPGYDPATGLFYAPNASFLPVPRSPSREDARRAAGRLLRPLRSFPFARPADKAAMAAEVLTLFTRHLYAQAPGFVHRAPDAGAGKTLLADVGAVIATGMPATNTAGAVIEDGEELKKLLTTWTLAAVPVGLLDNAPRGSVIDASELNQFITARTYGDRLLGANKEVKGPVVTVVIITGNGIDLRGDATRRFLIIDIDPGVERPEERAFDFDPVREAGSDRAELVRAALTLLRAYVVAGRPKVAKEGSFGGFEDWERWVRDPLVWAGVGDPLAVLAKTRTSDPERTALGATMAALRAAFGDAWFKAGEAMKRAADEEKLREALVEVALGKRGELEPRRLGRYLEKNKGRVCDGLKLVARFDTDTKSHAYRVAVQKEEDGSGSRGFRGSTGFATATQDPHGRACGREEQDYRDETTGYPGNPVGEPDEVEL